jgi:O-methyltransferase
MLKDLVQRMLARLGYSLTRSVMPIEFSSEDAEIVRHVQQNELSMASTERLYATLMACRHVLDGNIAGDFVECGVWRGGNALIAADLFRRNGSDRRVWLFDTFTGMTEPTKADVRNRDGRLAMIDFVKQRKADHNAWCYASLDDVKDSFQSRGLGSDNIKFVPGDVCATLAVADNLPERIAVLRLDTDWYESTQAELNVLYPRLVSGGVIIIDDYGYWGGARKAVDEYFRDKPRPFFHYIDDTGRSGVKC